MPKLKYIEYLVGYNGFIPVYFKLYLPQKIKTKKVNKNPINNYKGLYQKTIIYHIKFSHNFEGIENNLK
jgi:hypothetical protein